MCAAYANVMSLKPALVRSPRMLLALKFSTDLSAFISSGPITTGMLLAYCVPVRRSVKRPVIALLPLGTLLNLQLACHLSPYARWTADSARLRIAGTHSAPSRCPENTRVWI